MKNIDFFERKKYYIVYSVLFIICATMLFSWIWYDGYSITNYGDDIGQHMNVLNYLHDWYREIFNNVFVKHQLSIPMFEYSLGYGSDVIQTFSYNGIADPFYLLAMFVPKTHMEYLFWFLIVIRMYLSGITFSIYSLSHNNSKGGTCFGAITYCFSGFVLLAGIHQLMFLNATLYLPLVLLGADKLFRKHDGRLFTISVMLIAMSSFYWFYMIALFTIAYCCLFYLKNYRLTIRDVLKRIVIFLWYGLLGVMLAGFILMPVVAAMQNSGRLVVEKTIPLLYDTKYYFEQLAHFFTIERSYSAYLGFFPVALVGIFVLFVKRNSNKYLKVSFILLTICLCIPVCGYIFNGFGYVSNRWTFGYAFLISYILSYTFPKFLHLMPSEKKKLFVCILAYVIVCISNQFSRTEWAMSALLIVVIYCMAMLIIDNIRIFNVLTVIMLLISIKLTSVYAFSYEEGTDLEISRIKLGEVYDTMVYQNPTNVVLDINDCSLYRADSYNVINLENTFFANGISSPSFYFSVTNTAIEDTLVELGVISPTIQRLSNLDSRTILDTMAGVKYFVIRSGETHNLPYGYTKLVNKKEIAGVVYEVYENDYALPIIYTYNQMIDSKQWENLDVADKQELFLELAVFEGVSDANEADIQLTNENIEYEIQCSEGISVMGDSLVVEKAGATMSLNFRGVEDAETYLILNDISFQAIDVNEKMNYSITRYQRYKNQIDTLNSAEVTAIGITISSNRRSKGITYRLPEDEFYSGINTYLCNLGYSSEELTNVDVQFHTPGVYSIEEMQIKCQPMDSYVTKISELSKHTSEDVRIQGTRITATLNSDEKRYVCIALPYSTGWKAYVDGDEVDTYKCNGMYIGLEVDAGEKQLVMEYCTPGLKLGVLISSLGLFAFIITIGVYKRMVIRPQETI